MEIIWDVEAIAIYWWMETVAQYTDQSALWLKAQLFQDTSLAQTEIIIHCRGIIFNQIDPIWLNHSLGTIAFSWPFHKVWVNEIMDRLIDVFMR